MGAFPFCGSQTKTKHIKPPDYYPEFPGKNLQPKLSKIFGHAGFNENKTTWAALTPIWQGERSRRPQGNRFRI